MLTKTALTDEEKFQIRFIATELATIRKELLELAEAVAKLSDKQFMQTFQVEKEDFTEKQIDKLEWNLQKKVNAEEEKLDY